MPTRLTSTTLLLFALALQCLVACLPISLSREEIVLCVSGSGHIALERSSDDGDCCPDLHEHVEAAPSDCAVGARHFDECRDCFDLALQGNSQRLLRAQRDAALPAVAPACDIADAPHPAPVAFMAAARAIAPSSHLDAHRVTVLQV